MDRWTDMQIRQRMDGRTDRQGDSDRFLFH